jgi:hypothetical protein
VTVAIDVGVVARMVSNLRWGFMIENFKLASALSFSSVIVMLKRGISDNVI